MVVDVRNVLIDRWIRCRVVDWLFWYSLDFPKHPFVSRCVSLSWQEYLEFCSLMRLVISVFGVITSNLWLMHSCKMTSHVKDEQYMICSFNVHKLLVQRWSHLFKNSSYHINLKKEPWYQHIFQFKRIFFLDMTAKIFSRKLADNLSKLVRRPKEENDERKAERLKIENTCKGNRED